MESFGWALKQLKNGDKVSRSGWNGKGMWLKLINPGDYQINGNILTSPEIDRISPWIGIRTAIGDFIPWVASQNDLLENDWNIISSPTE